MVNVLEGLNQVIFLGGFDLKNDFLPENVLFFRNLQQIIRIVLASAVLTLE